MDDYYWKQYEINKTAKVLTNIGISMFESNGNYRPFNEVMKDLAKAIKKIRNTSENEEFEIKRDYIYNSIVGTKYKNQFMF